MAPKKKKKTPANPARGFSTVSTPSKPKHSDTPESEISNDGTDVASELEVPLIIPHRREVYKPMTDMPPNYGIQDMMPDQLDAHLEDAELESLLESNATKHKSDASRQVSRLRTEVRQLRTQCMPLTLQGWLDDSAVDEVLSLTSSVTEITTTDSDLLKYGDHRVLLDLWTLDRVLFLLNFPRREEVLAHVLRLAFTRQLKSDVKDLPNYQTSSIVSLNNSPHRSIASSRRVHVADVVLSSAETLSSLPAPKTDDKATDETSVIDISDISSQDDENDPMYLREKYIRLKTQIWEKEHAATDTKSSDDRHAMQIQKRRLKLADIERDILFDKDEADQVWKPIEIRLEAEDNIRQKAAKKSQLALSRSDGTSSRSGNGGESPEPSSRAPRDKNTDEDKDEDEDEDVFGSMFGPSEDQNDDQPHPLASVVRIVDFRTSTGTTPRQLLEQTCRAIDNDFKLRLNVLEQTSYSCRHGVDLIWTGQHTADQYAIQTVPPEISLTLTPHKWTVEMQKIAAKTVEQSVSYAATVMLFLISSLEGQPSQISLRLAGSWRDLMATLSDSRKEVIRSHDKIELKRLRSMVDLEKDKFEAQKTNQSSLPTVEEKSTFHVPIHQRVVEKSNFTPERAQREWSSRATSPAYQEMLKIRQSLPIHQSKSQILQTVYLNPISIICAETGSGKSTQCGSFILEQELSSGRDCRILITQPRRISAISLARRVSQELGEGPSAIGTVRSLIGYSIRLESKTSLTTRLTFATTGVLLRMLESSPMLEQLDCLILDEVHECTLETDLLFIALRELLKKRMNLKIILMSATVDAKTFSDYFGGAPVLDIPGRTFPVDIRFLEDAIEATNAMSDDNVVSSPEMEESEVDVDDQPISESTVKTADLTGYNAKTLKRLSQMHQYRIDYDLIVKLAITIATKPTYESYSSAILIFMPGIAEIRRLHRALSTTEAFATGWHLHMLHSSFSTEELERALSPPHEGERKIVIATNIAETGITIPDVTAVIDTCKEKVMRYDERRQLSKLTEGFISRSSAKQRRGRAARVRAGLCFHLVTRHHHDNLLQEQSTPEILRLGLQDPILRIKIWNFGSAEETLSAAITPPSKKNIVRAVEKLREAGALNGLERLTPLGEQVARLPLDIALSKLALFGVIFQCLDPVLTIISIMTSKSPFTNEMAAKTYFSRSDSDLISTFGAYEGWKKARVKGSAFEFCRKNWLSDYVLMQIEEQKVQLLVYLADGGQIDLSREEKTELSRARTTHHFRRDFYEIPQRYNRAVGDELLLCLISMAFYPRILVKDGRGWRNVYTNQQVSLAKRSVNDGGSKSVKWLSFSEAMRARPGNLNVYETSRVPEVAITLLLGQAEMKLFSGVLSIDSGKTRLAVGNWKQAIAIKVLREALLTVLDRCHRAPGQPLPEMDQRWLRLLLDITALKEVGIR